MIQLNYDKHNNVVLNYICKAISLLTSGYEEDLKIQFWKRTLKGNNDKELFCETQAW